jgi:hypothetical protein
MSFPKMKKDRLERLAKELRNFARRKKTNLKFDLGSWVDTTDDYRHEDPTVVARGALNADNYCGTTACACGLAALIPEFNKKGFKLQLDTWGDLATITYKDWEGFAAAEEFFGLTDREAAFVFHPSYYDDLDPNDPKVVANRIMQMVRQDKSLSEHAIHRTLNDHDLY